MIEQIRPADLDAWIARFPGATPFLIDVREPWELQIANLGAQVGGATVVAIPMNEIPARLGELDPTRPVACLCHHGARSQRVATFLAQSGFEDVVNIAGGIDAWSASRDAGVPRY
ncbi:MAG: rhodanese-like domain-containing protein [Janthinobacterium lividum]